MRRGFHRFQDGAPDAQRFLSLLTCFAALAALALVGCQQPSAPSSDTFWITNVRLIDGTGAPVRRADVHVAGGRIAAVGDFTIKAHEKVVDGGGLVLAPGFIDTHSHADFHLTEEPDMLVAASQGITTVVIGQDGSSSFPLSEMFAALTAQTTPLNIASYSGHGTLRSKILGTDFKRPATEEEVAAMAALLQQDMDAGSLGLGTGLEYVPGLYSETSEVIALARVASDAGGRYASHVRSEDRRFWEAVEETLEIGREAGIPVHISHLKLAMRSNWGQADRLLTYLDQARADGIDVTADVYPYTRWQSSMTILFPEQNFNDIEEAMLVTREVASPEQIMIPLYEPDPEVAGKTLAQVAAIRGRDAATVLVELVNEIQVYGKTTGKQDFESIIAESMTEADVLRILQWPHVSICTDGFLRPGHPRASGTFPRVLNFAHEHGLFSLEEAVRRMTSQAAANVGLEGRGTVTVGQAADLVLFDPERVRDRSTFQEPATLSEGIGKVWVNGVVVFDGRESTGARPGQVLRRATRKTASRQERKL